MTQTLSGELADGQKKLLTLAVSGANSKLSNPLVSHMSNGPLLHEKVLSIPLNYFLLDRIIDSYLYSVFRLKSLLFYFNLLILFNRLKLLLIQSKSYQDCWRSASTRRHSLQPCTELMCLLYHGYVCRYTVCSLSLVYGRLKYRVL